MNCPVGKAEIQLPPLIVIGLHLPSLLGGAWLSMDFIEKYKPLNRFRVEWSLEAHVVLPLKGHNFMSAHAECKQAGSSVFWHALTLGKNIGQVQEYVFNVWRLLEIKAVVFGPSFFHSDTYWLLYEHVIGCMCNVP